MDKKMTVDFFLPGPDNHNQSAYILRRMWAGAQSKWADDASLSLLLVAQAANRATGPPGCIPVLPMTRPTMMSVSEP